jgi:hypothetical protein
MERRTKAKRVIFVYSQYSEYFMYTWECELLVDGRNMQHELGNKILIKLLLWYNNIFSTTQIYCTRFIWYPAYLSIIGQIWTITTIIWNHPVALGLVVYLRTCRILTSLKYSAHCLETDIVSTAWVTGRQAQFIAVLLPRRNKQK